MRRPTPPSRNGKRSPGLSGAARTHRSHQYSEIEVFNGEKTNCRLNGSEVSKDKCVLHEKPASTGAKSTCRSVLSTQCSVAGRDLGSTGGGVMPVVCSDERGPSLPLSRICELLRSGPCRGRSILFSLQWEGVCLEWLVWDRKTAGSAGDIVARLLAFNRWQMPPGQPKAEPTQCRDLGKDPWESGRQVFASIGTGNKLAYRQGSDVEEGKY